MPFKKTHMTEDYGPLKCDLVLFGTTRHISENAFTAVGIWGLKY
jgi:hypothetical protein